MKTYVCDSCERIIDNPHFVKMKEFYFTYYDVEYGKMPAKSKYKIHLCDACFHALHDIANRRTKKNNG